MVTEVANSASLKQQLIANQSGGLLLTYIHADFSSECQQMEEVIRALSSDAQFSNVTFIKVDAQKPTTKEILSTYNVTNVPCCLFFKRGELVGRLVGADPSELANAIGRYLMTPAPANAQIATGASEAAPKPTIATSDDTNSGLTPELRARLEQLVNQSPLMVFMKGSPDNVRCKFSRQMVELLNETKLSYGHFDILSDESVRQGLKQLSNWPTYPQLYAGGRLVGGVDIVSQMRADGSLLPELRAAFESK